MNQALRAGIPAPSLFAKDCPLDFSEILVLLQNAAFGSQGPDFNFRQSVKSVDGLVDRIRELQEQLIRVDWTRATAQAEVQRLTKALVETQARIVALEDKERCLQEQ